MVYDRDGINCMLGIYVDDILAAYNNED